MALEIEYSCELISTNFYLVINYLCKLILENYLLRVWLGYTTVKYIFVSLVFFVTENDLKLVENIS